MGRYTHYNISCEISEEFVKLVHHYIHHNGEENEWPEPKPEFILEWERFLKRTGHCSVYKATPEHPKEEIFYDYIGMGGMDGYWKHKLELDSQVLSVAGCCKNYNFELEYFVQQVLILGMGGTICMCETTNDDMLNMEYSLKEPIMEYSDNYLRNHSIFF